MRRSFRHRRRRGRGIRRINFVPLSRGGFRL